jgi:regulator of protease activity HflC (stomatin/prohibitin superfamily)
MSIINVVPKFIAFVLFLLAIYLSASRFVTIKLENSERRIGSRGENTTPVYEKYRLPFSTYICLTFSILFFLIGSCLFYAEPGYIYYVQYPTGGYTVLSNPGYSIQPLARIYPWKQHITIKLSDLEENTSETQSIEDNSITGVRFNDAVSAAVGVSVRFSLPTNPEQFKQLHIEYRSEQSLIQSTLIPNIYESIRNAMRLISAQEYVSGRGGVLEEAFIDQLKDGLYSMTLKDKMPQSNHTINTQPTKQITTEDLIASSVTPIDDPENANILIEPKVDRYGNIERVNTTSLKEKGINITLAVIDSIIFEEAFLQRLENQKKASTAAAQASQEVKQAEQETLKAKAEADKAIAIERGVYEKEQTRITIESETALKKAKIEQQTAEIEKQTASINAEKEIIAAGAAAKSKTLIAEADNNLTIKIEAMKYMTDKFADSLSKNELVPKVFISGGSNTGVGSFPNGMDTFQNIMSVWMTQQLGLLDLDLNIKTEKE